MDFLLDPNIAYFLLVAAFVLAAFAVLTPGTGVLELSALFAFVLAGWEIYNLPVNLWALGVLFLGVIPFAFAVRGRRRSLNLSLAALALVLGSLFMFRSDDWWRPAVHPAMAVIVSLLVGGFFWLVVSKVLEAGSAVPSHDLGGLVGATGEARTEVHQEGSVYVRGEMWAARSPEPIEVGAKVRVVGREGFILQVEPLKDPD